MKKINLPRLLFRVFLPTVVLSSLYLLIGWFCHAIPHILLFCLIALFTMVPIELGFILYDSKKECGQYSFKSAFAGQEKIPLWQIILYAAFFFGAAGLASAFIQPAELQLLGGVRNHLLSLLPVGFDWNDMEYLKSFPRATLVATCVFYGIFNVHRGVFFQGISDLPLRKAECRHADSDCRAVFALSPVAAVQQCIQNRNLCSVGDCCLQKEEYFYQHTVPLSVQPVFGHFILHGNTVIRK